MSICPSSNQALDYEIAMDASFALQSTERSYRSPPINALRSPMNGDNDLETLEEAFEGITIWPIPFAEAASCPLG